MKRVLIVDDSKTVRNYHKHILADAGYDVHEAENGMEALEKVLDNRFALFLVDINMPVMDGYRFVESLRKDPEYTTTPVIMISTEAEEEDREKGYRVGVNLYYVKPVKPDALLHSATILTQR